MDTLRPIPWHEGDGAADGRPRVARRLGRGRLAAPDPAPPARAPRRARLDARTPAPSSSSSCSATPTRRPGSKGYRDLEPANLYNVDYSMLGTARVEPLIRRIRNSMMAAGMRVENSKGECNFGQHEINFRYDEALATADDHVIYKNGAKEIAAQEGYVDHLHGQVRRARGQLVPHPLLARRTRTAATCSPTTSRSSTTSSPASSPALRELTLFFAPHVNSYKRFVAGLVRADRGGVGQGQPHLLDARRRPRAGAARGEPAAGRRRQPVPRAGGDDRRRPARDRQRARARAGVRGQRLRVRQAARAATRCTRRATCSPSRRSRARRSARRSSTTT